MQTGDLKTPTPWYAWVILALAVIGITVITVLSFTGCTSAPVETFNPSVLRSCSSVQSESSPECLRVRKAMRK